MKNLSESGLKIKKNVLYFFILLSIIAFIVISYIFNISTPMQVVLWGLWLVSASVMFYFTDSGQWVISFSKEAKIELKKVIWPTRQETVQVTLLVMVMVVAASLILWTCDLLMFWAVGKITHLG